MLKNNAFLIALGLASLVTLGGSVDWIPPSIHANAWAESEHLEHARMSKIQEFTSTYPGKKITEKPAGQDGPTVFEHKNKDATVSFRWCTAYPTTGLIENTSDRHIYYVLRKDSNGQFVFNNFLPARQLQAIQFPSLDFLSGTFSLHFTGVRLKDPSKVDQFFLEKNKKRKRISSMEAKQ